MSGNQNLFQEAMREGHRLAWAMKWDAAVDCYHRAVAEFPEDAAAVSSLATALLRLGHYDDAADQFSKLLELTPDDETALVHLAETQERSGKDALVAHTFFKLANHYADSGQTEKAVKVWVKLSELSSDDLEVQEKLYHCLSRAGEASLAGKVGLTITRLRGELHGRAALTPVRSATRPESPTTPPDVDATALTRAQHELAQADAIRQSGTEREAFLGYVRAVATLRQAGVVEQIAAVERETRNLRECFGGLRLRDFPVEGDAKWPKVLDRMIATRTELDRGEAFATVDECFAGIADSPDYLPFQEALAEAQHLLGDVQGAYERYLNVAEAYLMRREAQAAEEGLAMARRLRCIPTETMERFIGLFLEIGANAAAVTQLIAMAEDFRLANDHIAALHATQRAAEVAPHDLLVLISLAAAFEENGELTAASEHYRLVLSDPSLALAQRVEGALRLTVTSSLLASHDDLEYGLSALLKADGGSLVAAKAEERYAAAVALHQENMALRLCYGCLLMRLARKNEGIAQLSTAAGAGGFVGAAAHLALAEECIDDDPPAMANHLAIAESALTESSASSSELPIKLRRLLAELHFRRGDIVRAVAAFNAVKAITPNETTVYTRLAELHFRRGDADAALRELVELGDLRSEAGQYELALSTFQGAAQLATDRPEVKAKLSETYRRLDRIDAALAVMDELALLHIRGGEVEQAVAVLGEMIELCRQTDPAMALALRKRVAALAPASFEARQAVIGAYLASGQSDVALSESTRLWQDMVATKRWREAASALEQILHIDPWNIDALVRLAELWDTMGERDRSIECLRRAINIDPHQEQANATLRRLMSMAEDTQ